MVNRYALSTLALLCMISTFGSEANAQGKMSVKVKEGKATEQAGVSAKKARYYYNHGEDFREKKAYKEAIEQYQKAIALDPKEIAFYKNMGGTYALMGDMAQAEATFRKGTKIAPTDWLIWNNLAVVLLQQNKNEECKIVLKKALTLNPPPSKAEEMNVTLTQLEGKKTAKKPG